MTAPLIGLTGATGAVGGRVARLLADRAPRLLVRDPARAAAVAAASGDGEVRRFVYADADPEALRGVEVLLLVSGAESATRRAEHRAAVAAAVEAGVGHVVYTSFTAAAPGSTFTLGRDHADTEAALREAADAGVAVTLLRDNLYSDLLPLFADEDGVLRGPAARGRVAAVARRDVAEVAAHVLRDPAPHAGARHDLTGPEALTMTEVATRAGAVLGRPLRFVDETVEEAYASRRAAYPDAPDWQLDAWVSTYTAIADGSLAPVSDAVPRLLGRPALTLEQALADAASGP